MLLDHGEEPIAVTLGLGGPDSVGELKGGQIHGPQPGDIPQRAVAGHHVGGDALEPGDLHPVRA